LNFGGATNPRTTQQTQTFEIDTFDSKGNQIDQGFKVSTQMTQANLIQIMSVTSDSQVNGALSNYTFSINTPFPLMQGDVITYTFPNDISPPSVSNPNCSKVVNDTNVQNVSC
jgi:hypothetical protein